MIGVFSAPFMQKLLGGPPKRELFELGFHSVADTKKTWDTAKAAAAKQAKS
jgi:hypothetical protein